ncbi:hypothetical protein K1719_039829 [Acacia pycnantha]|nr:hypothetical protein K1719_039829 [Acacia pycnantha]
MAGNDEGNSGSGSSSSSPVRKKVRGTTELKGLRARRKNQKESVRIQLDADQNPIGPEENRFVSYIGHLGRRYVGLKYDRWRNVGDEMRDHIWAQLLDELVQQTEEGSFTPTGRMDILATAIGKPNHPGQVRGEPTRVGLSRYFGRRISRPSEEELVQKITTDVEQRLGSQFEKKYKRWLRSIVNRWLSYDVILN